MKTLMKWIGDAFASIGVLFIAVVAFLIFGVPEVEMTPTSVGSSQAERTPVTTPAKPPAKPARDTAAEKYIASSAGALRRTLRSRAKDPSSAEFRNLNIIGQDVCLNYRSKNSFGAFVPWKTYCVTPAREVVER